MEATGGHRGCIPSEANRCRFRTRVGDQGAQQQAVALGRRAGRLGPAGSGAAVGEAGCASMPTPVLQLSWELPKASAWCVERWAGLALWV